MATQWPQHSQQLHQYHQPPQYQQPPQHQVAQQYQQPQYQATPQFPQNGHYSQSTSQQYQQPIQQYAQNQPYQQATQQYPQAQAYQLQGQYSQTQPYQHQGQYSQAQPHQQQGQYSQVQQQSHPAQYPQGQAYQQPTQQYPLTQFYQQQGQYPHGQQHPQAGQYPQAQPYQQPPQQYPEAQQQAYSSHQQQYATEQYPAQQYSPQQHAPTHHVAGQQACQHQASPINAQGPTLVASNSCFNCGTPNHFAQDCPEPKRPIPAGALDPRKYANPLKRNKPGGAVVTKFFPPQSSHVQGYPQGYPPSTHGQSGQTQFQGSYSPTTSTSAQTQAQQQAWQQYYQWQAHQQHQQPQQHLDASHQPQYVHTPTHQNTPYVNPAQQSHQPQYFHTPNHQYTPYGNPSQPSTQASPQAPQDIPAFQPYYAGHMHAQPSPTGNTVSAQYVPETVAHVAGMERSDQRQQNILTVPAHSESMATSPQIDSGEAEDDDLNLLDVPDLPKGAQEYAEINHLPNTIVSPPASLISMPLPANFVVADALYPIPPPDSEDEGRCRSKYLRDVTLETLYEHIAASKYWKDHKDDTIFLVRPDEDTTIQVVEMREQLKQRHERGEGKDDLNRLSRSQSQGVSALKDSVDVTTKVEKLEREIAEMKERMRQKALAKGKHVSPTAAAAEGSPSERHMTVKEEQSTPPRAATIQVVRKSEKQDTEDLLAALGVTGSPKPVIAAIGTYSGLQTSDWPVDDLGQRQINPDKDFPIYSSENGLPPPPPPPPPYHQSPLPEIVDGSPTSAEVNYSNGYAFTTNGVDHVNGYHSTGPDGEVLTPDELRYEDPRSRKRSFNRRGSSSDEEDAPARRQEDDVTPKLKRRQPKVAAAYSRRW